MTPAHRDQCLHEHLISHDEQEPREKIIWCRSCGKRIAIPERTLHLGEEAVAGLLDMVFGEAAAKRYRQGFFGKTYGKNWK